MPSTDGQGPRDEFDMRVFQAVDRYMKDPLRFPKEFKTWMPAWVEQEISTSVDRLPGFTRWVPNAASRVNTSETTASSSFTDLATAGPVLSSLPDGLYVVLFGFTGSQSGGTAAFMGVQANATVATDDLSCRVAGGSLTSVATAVSVELGAGSNSITAKYKQSGGGTGTFSGRWLVALRYGN